MFFRWPRWKRALRVSTHTPFGVVTITLRGTGREFAPEIHGRSGHGTCKTRGKAMRTQRQHTPRDPLPQTRGELQMWVRRHLGLTARDESLLIEAFDSVFH